MRLFQEEEKFLSDILTAQRGVLFSLQEPLGSELHAYGSRGKRQQRGTLLFGLFAFLAGLLKPVSDGLAQLTPLSSRYKPERSLARQRGAPGRVGSLRSESREAPLEEGVGEAEGVHASLDKPGPQAAAPGGGDLLGH